MTVKYLKLLWYRFCPLKPEIARFSIGFRLNSQLLTVLNTFSRLHLDKQI